MTHLEKINSLQKRLDVLLHQQDKARSEIYLIKKELKKLLDELQPTTSSAPAIASPIVEEKTAIVPPPSQKHEPRKPLPPKDYKASSAAQARSLEQYIGGNIINKVGMVILLLGLGLFVKYAIDKGLFPPAMRVVLGYLSGMTLVGIAYALKKKYVTYSAVLFSGGMAVMYFTSYLANTFFDPPVLTSMVSFFTMVIFTIITVGVAMHYDQQVIGLLGLVGGYAVPILISDGSDNYLMLFIYLAILNFGVMVLAARKNWRAMTYIGFLFTWVIFLGWMISDYHGNNPKDLVIGWIFSILFFQMFYAALVLYQLRHKEKFSIPTIVFIILNALFFYLCHIVIIDDTFKRDMVGIGTLLNALIHFGFSYVMYHRMENKKPFLFLSSIGIVLLTIAIPFEFELTNMILMWTMEVIALFYISRKYDVKTYQILSLIAGGIVLLVMILGWFDNYTYGGMEFPVLLNNQSLIALIAAAGAGVLMYLNRFLEKEKYSPYLNSVFGGVLLSIVFAAFFGEIEHFFQTKIYAETSRTIEFQLQQLKHFWQMTYTLGFLAGIGFLNIWKWKHETLFAGVVSFGSLLLLIFGGAQIFILNEMRSDFLAGTISLTSELWWLRYVFYGFGFLLLGAIYFSLKKAKTLESLRPVFPIIFHGAVLVVLTNELSTVMLFQMESATSELPRKVGYSILWGVYSLFLIARGLLKEMQLLRIGGMILFAVTLLKVFFLDLSGISTVSRTIIFIALGILLLIVSFLYQKFQKSGEG